MKKPVARLRAGDMGKTVRFATDDFGKVVGTLVEFGVPDDHPSLWTHPIQSIEVKVKAASGARFSFELPAETKIEVVDA